MKNILKQWWVVRKNLWLGGHNPFKGSIYHAKLLWGNWQ